MNNVILNQIIYRLEIYPGEKQTNDINEMCNKKIYTNSKISYIIESTL